MKFFKKTLFLLITLISLTHCQEFFGCYKYDATDMEFLAFASHLDPTMATPELCAIACDTMGYSFSAILSSTMCFCKHSAPSKSVKVSDDVCFLSGICPANTKQYCGYSDYMLVYTGVSSITFEAVSNPSSLNLFGSISYTYNGSEPSKNVIIRTDNSLISGYSTLTGTANYVFTKLGYTFLEATASGRLMKDSNSKRKVLTSPLVKDDMTSYTYVCPTQGISNELFTCELKFDKGTGTMLTIDYNDGTIDSVTLPDSEVIPFGIPVPLQISKTLITLPDTTLMYLYNTFFTTDGVLRGVEIYASTPGAVAIKILRHTTCTTLYKLQNPTQCADIRTTYMFACASNFNKYSSKCSNEGLSAANFYSLSSFSQVVTETVTLTAGYNLVKPFSGLQEVSQGWFLGIEQTVGKVSIDISGEAPLSDYNGNQPINSSINAAFHVRALLTKQIPFAASNFYANRNPYTQKISVVQPSGLVDKTSNFVIYDRVMDLSVTTENGECKKDIPCLFTANILKGNNVTYVWRFPTENVTTTVPELRYTFTIVGSIDVVLFASNPVSNATYLFSIKVLVVVINPRLTVNNPISGESASIVGKPAEFVFTLDAGLGYSCNINYGDSTTLNFDDTITSMNNTKFLKTYTTEREFTVSIMCRNSISNASFTFKHVTQFEITNVRLTKWFSFRNLAFNVEFAIDSGSSPQFDLWYDNEQETSVTWDPVTRTGKGKSRIESSSSLHKVNLTVSNKVSRVFLNRDFEIGAKIRNPQFLITNSNSFRPNHYHFGTQLNFVIKMEDGANVRLRFFFGDLETINYEVTTTGDWNSDYTLSYTHIEPGDFNMFVVVYNAFDSFVLYQNISVVSDVNNLIPGLSENPVVFSPLGSFANFMFSYEDNTKSGSHARVTLWPGDMFNQSFGPYLLGMNFKLNSSVNRLMYRYQAEGNYKVVFLVENLLGSKFYQFEFLIRQGVYGLYLNFPSVVPAGNVFKIETYLLQGDNVTYEWTFDGVTKTAKRLSTDVSVPDYQNFTTTIASNATLTVKASDSSSAQNLKYLIEVQTPVLNASVKTTPSDTSAILFDGTAASRTVVIEVEAIDNPTNPFVLIDFGDGKPAENAVYLSGPYQKTYTYDNIGAYTITVTIFNKISSKKFFRTVRFLSDILSFRCIPRWRMVPVDGTEETSYTPVNGVFRFDRERDLRLHCTWTNGLVEKFTIDINSITQIYLNLESPSLRYTRDGNSFSIILPYLTTSLKLVTTSSVVPMRVSYSNSRFTRNVMFNVSLFSSIILKDVIETTDILQPGSNYTFMVNYETLAEPSCSSITLNSSNFRRVVSIGTNAATCQALFPGLNYEGAYNVSSSVWRINTFLPVEGIIRMTAVVRNSATSQTVSSSVTVTSVACAPPILEIENRAEYFYNPSKIARTKMITLLGSATLRCNLTLSNNKSWSVFLVNPTNGDNIRRLDLSSIRSASFAEIIIQPNTLSYGLYKFVYTVRMIGPSLMGRVFESSVDHYIKIVPTGIVVMGVRGGVREQRLGIEQEFDFNPAEFSFDQDGLISPRNLKFKFYCTTVDSGIVRGYPQRNAREKLDLLSLKSGTFTMTSNTTCFESPNGFALDTTGNVLRISTAFLTYYKIRIYRFMIATTYLDEEYYQEFDLNLDYVKKTPLITLGCNPAGECKPYPSFQKINPSSQLRIIGNCEIGCEDVLSIKYSFQIFRKLFKPTVDDAWIPFWMPHIISNSSRASNGIIFLNGSHVIGSDTSQMVMFSDLFKLDELSLDYKIDLSVEIISLYGINTGSSSLTLRKNLLPEKGSCSITPSQGLAMETEFTIDCLGWKDNDGIIKKYEYYATYQGLTQPFSLGYDTTGKSSFELPLGPAFDDFKMYIYIEVVDNDDGVSRYHFDNPVIVKENTDLLNELISSVASADPTSAVNSKLFSGEPKVVLTVVSSITSMLNNQGFGDKNSVSSSKSIVGFGPFQGIPSNANFDNLDSINITATYKGAAENSLDNSTYDENREKRSQVRDALFSQINNVGMSDLSSLKLWSGVLSSATQSSDELSRSSAEVAANQAINLAAALNSVSNTASLDNLKQITTGIIGTIQNVATGLSSSLSGYSNDLKKDIKDASIPDGDNDLENFFNSDVNLNSDPTVASLSEAEKINNFKKKFQLVDAVQKSQAVVDLASKILSNRLNNDQSIDIDTPSVSMKIKKVTASDLPSALYQGLSKITLPNFCDLVKSEPVNVTNTTNPFYTPPKDPNSCDNKAIVIRSRNEPIAPTGVNGANETNIQDSNTVSLEFTSDDSKEIKITNSREPIDIWIPRNPTVVVEFLKINATNLTLPKESAFLPNGITINSVNTSVFIQIQPYSYDIGYFVWYKIGITPIFNDTSKGFCPHNLKTVRGESYYQMTINQSEINGFKGFIGIGLREMSQEEFDTFCDVNQTMIVQPITRNMTNFTSDFGFRLFSSACYFFDVKKGVWSSDGVDIMDDSNVHYTHCKSKHLTSFAGGFIVLPPAINFEKVFANASFDKNPTIYITVIVASVLFIVFMLIARYMDLKDSKKLGLNLLPDNNPHHDYCYELIVFTGSRQEAATDSKVRFILSGEEFDTGIRLLSDPKRKLFRRGGIDSFIMAVDRPLGQLSYLRIWHDNSGEDDYASWYLKFVIIRDLQTKEKFYFLCERWFAVEKDDGQIDRLLPMATEVQKTNLQYLAQKETKKKLSDEHLWLSILSRPVQSPFTRMDRVTCCFVLLYITMLMNILYYGVDTDSNRGGLAIGPFLITPTQIGIGIMTNLIIFPPTLLLVYLFRNSRAKSTPLKKLDKRMNKESDQKISNFDDLMGRKSPIPEVKPKKKKSKGLPWWCKIIAYVLSAFFMGISIFFVIIQGVNLGDEKVQKWLTSFFVSILSSVLLTQPVKIVLTALVVILICRKSNDVADTQHDGDEDDNTFENKRNLNKDLRFDKYRDYSINIDSGKLTHSEISEARKSRESEVMFWKMIKEVTAYFIFLMILFMFTYSTRNPNAFIYKTQLEKFLIDEDFESIQKTEDVWKWTINNLAPKIRIQKWYNDETVNRMGGFFNDFTSRMVGYAVLRTNRVKNNSCTNPPQMKNETEFCVEAYNIFNEDKEKYSYAWSEYNSTHEPENGMDRVYKAFQYRHSGKLPIYSEYSEGGYIYEMRGKLDFIRGNMSILQQMNWIDRQTRSVFIEFNVFNPNINLFSISYILFEILPSGNILKTARFNVLNLLTTKDDAIEIGTGVAYLAIIVYFMFREIVKMFKLKKMYFKQFWSYIQWSLIIFSWAALGMYVYRVLAGEKVKKFFMETKGYGYLKLTDVSYWNDMFAITMAICTCLATMKFIKLLRFNTNVRVLITAIRNCFDELLGITFMLVILFVAFTQIFYVIFNEKIMGFSTVVKSMTTCFQVLLGKFEVGPILRESYILGPLIFASYNLMVLIIILSVFITVISDNFIEVKRNKESYLIETDLTKYLFKKIKSWAGRRGITRNKNKQSGLMADSSSSYVDETDLLSNRLGKLLVKVNDYKKEKMMYDNILDETAESPYDFKRN